MCRCFRNHHHESNASSKLPGTGIFRFVHGSSPLHPSGIPRCNRGRPHDRKWRLDLLVIVRRDRTRLKIAAILTEFTYRSHAHVILENFVEPYLFNGELTSPGMDVVSLYVDQFPDKDMAREFAAKYSIPIYKTIASALCLGGDKLAVDAVLSIGEHGKYPVNEKGQHEYPRKRFFDEIVAVFRPSERVVPVFNDKHLSYRWDWAKEMYDTARELKCSVHGRQFGAAGANVVRRWNCRRERGSRKPFPFTAGR